MATINDVLYQNEQLDLGNSGVTEVVASSGNVANASATASLSAVTGATNYITGFEVTAAGATAALDTTVTVTGLIGGVTLSYTFVFPLGATAQATPLVVQFARPIPANAPNLAITVTCPAGGAGNTNTCVNIHGFRK